jgi:mannan endo-1,4-beta-mannosidase
MKDAGMKVLRVWVDGEVRTHACLLGCFTLLTCSQSTASSKGTKITSYPSLEQNAVGTYDDTVLKLLDQVMLDAHDHGIKVSSRLSLTCIRCADINFPAADQHALVQRA